jgi:hypothetical protein
MTDRPTLDAALAAWATTEPAGAGDQAALARILGHAETIATPPAAPARPRAGSGWQRPGWMLGGALAASFAIALLLAPRPGPDGMGAGSQSPGGTGVVLARAGDVEGGSVMPADGGSDTRAAFALLYTPTVEEEYQL